MWKLITTLIMLFVTLGSFITTLINTVRLLVVTIRQNNPGPVVHLLKRNLVFFGSVALLMIIFIWIAQITAYTLQIKDSYGNKVEGSIAELRKVTLNGRDE